MREAVLIRNARLHAGLTQAELARRAGTTQSAIARLEAGRGNPTVGTLTRLLALLGRRLELAAPPLEAAVDLEQLDAHLALTPAQRLSAFTAAYENTRKLLDAARPA